MRGIAILALLAPGACDQDRVVGKELPPLAPGHLAPRWSTTIGGLEITRVSRITLDSQGDVVVTGTGIGTLDLAAGAAVLPPTLIEPWTSETPWTSFVTKRSGVNGSFVWGAAIETGAQAYASQLAIDPAHNIYVAGYTITDLGQSLSIAKYSDAGVLLWKQSLDDTSFATPGGLAVGPQGEVYVSGSFSGTVDFGAGSVTCGDAPIHGITGDAFLARLGPDGSWLWANVYGGSGVQGISQLALMTDQRIVATPWWFGADSAFGGDVMPATEFGRTAIASYDPSGTHRWSHPIASGGEQLDPTAVAPDIADQIVVSGQQLESGGVAALGIYVFDGDGLELDATSRAHPALFSSAMTPGGMIVSSGSLGTWPTAIDLGTGPIEGMNAVSVLDEAGTVLGAAGYSSGQIDGLSPTDLSIRAVAANGDVIALGGEFNYSVDVGLGTHWAHGSGPFEPRAYTLNGVDGIVALFDWVTD